MGIGDKTELAPIVELLAKLKIIPLVYSFLLHKAECA
jgi:hypothetical protein